MLTKEFSIPQDIKHLEDGSLILTYCKYYNCQNGSLVISVQPKGFVSAFLYDEPQQDETGAYMSAMPRHQLFTSNEYPVKISASFNDYIRDVLHYNLMEFKANMVAENKKVNIPIVLNNLDPDELNK